MCSTPPVSLTLAARMQVAATSRYAETAFSPAPPPRSPLSLRLPRASSAPSASPAPPLPRLPRISAPTAPPHLRSPILPDLRSRRSPAPPRSSHCRLPSRIPCSKDEDEEMDDHDSDDVDEDSEEDDGDDEDEMGVERREDGRGAATDSSTAEKEEVAVASDGVEYSEQPPAAICCVLMEPWTSRHQEMPLGRRRRPLGDPPPPASGRCTPNSESRRRHPLSVSHRRAAAMPPLPRLLHHHLSLSLLHRQPPRRPWPPVAHAFLRRGLASSSSPATAAAAGREKSSRRTLAYLLGVAAAMVGASYAAVPLYRRFCQATGYGGTVQRRESVEEKISRHARDGTMTSREIIVQFNADVADGMPWKFIPTQREVRVKPGESALAFYTAENRSSAPITGVSTYNVAPMKAAIYFNKIQCFCFEEQTLLPGEQIDMPVFFYIDPEFETDPKMDGVNNIVLSYTFFKVNDS